MPPERRQAVVLIHGIGEQKPMNTLRGFVDAIWLHDTAIQNQYAATNAGGVLWSKPDNVSDSFELRRLTTIANSAGIRTDFFEFYWQHLMQGTTYRHVVAWAVTLVCRWPSTVPRQLKLAYWLLWLLVAAGVAFALSGGVAWLAGQKEPWRWLVGTVLVWPLMHIVVRSFIGDAARYLHVAPTNVQCRHEIRQAGVTLLNKLHERNYDRIIIAGHSLGSVIGYDILTHAWPTYNKAKPTSATISMNSLDALEDLAVKSDSVVDDVQKAQRAYLNELVANGNAWRVTDFVTMGSPLAHAEILLARDRKALEIRQNDREFPTCLPAMENARVRGQDVRRFSYQLSRDDPASYRAPNHAAVFAPTRWTNLYFPSSWIVRGDLIGGPLAGVMGSAVRDIKVTTSLWWGFLSHTLYWKGSRPEEAPDHVQALRRAIDLIDSRK
jgi:hypothetical protein